jgi:hypothetical protein
LQFARVDVDYCFDAFLTKRRQASTLWPANSHGRRTERQCLENVGSAPNSAVHEYRHFALYRSNNLRNAIDGCTQRLLVAATMVGNDDAVDTLL